MRTRKRIKRGFALLTVGAVLMISSFFFYKHLIRPGQIKSDHFSSDYYNDCVTNNLEQDFPEGCVVFFGNSLMAEFPLEMVQSDYKLVKYAVRGAFSEELLRRKSLLDFHPEKIILLLGINDILVGFDHEDVVGNIEQFIQLAQKANTEIAIISLLPVSFRDGVFAKRDHVNSEVFFCNLALKNLADDEGCGFIELHSKFCDSDGTLKADLTYDGVHLTTKGHLLWADAFSNFLTE